MIKINKLISTVFGIGYVGKGGGTLAAFLCCLLWKYMMVWIGYLSLSGLVVFLVTYNLNYVISK